MASRTSREIDSGTRRVVRGTRLAVVVVAVFAAILANASGSAADTATDCADVAIVWARGSGDETVTPGATDNDEGREFMVGVWRRLPHIENLMIYELGRDNLKYGIDHSYPAYGPTNGEAYDAWRSSYSPGWPASFLKEDGYVSSVRTGVKELTALLTQRASQCPWEIFVLGGYSQGAHVIGRALTDEDEGIPKWTRDRIAFVALMGDPTLWLPKGAELYRQGKLGFLDLWYTEEWRPVACRGGIFDIEPYRRGDGPCETVHGILTLSEGRSAYVPDDMITGPFGFTWTSRVGSWCLSDDPVCANTGHRFLRYVLSGNGAVGSHDDYTNRDRGPDGYKHWVDHAAAEAAFWATERWESETEWKRYAQPGSKPPSP